MHVAPVSDEENISMASGTTVTLFSSLEMFFKIKYRPWFAGSVVSAFIPVENSRCDHSTPHFFCSEAEMIKWVCDAINLSIYIPFFVCWAVVWECYDVMPSGFFAISACTGWVNKKTTFPSTERSWALWAMVSSWNKSGLEFLLNFQF